MNHKLSDPSTWKPRIEDARARGAQIAAVCGGFDLLHGGHIDILEAARAVAGFVVVGLHSDGAIHEARGSGHPLVDAVERAELLECFEAVDLVILLDAGSESALVETVQPDVYVAGGGGPLPDLPDNVQVHTIPMLSGRKDQLIERIVQS